MRKTPPSIQIMSAAAGPVPGRTEGAMTSDVIRASVRFILASQISAFGDDVAGRCAVCPDAARTGCHIELGFTLEASAAFPKNDVG
jgi:hypothetical protein